MNIDGTYTIQAPLEVVHNYLHTKPNLKQLIPGLVHFERSNKDSYNLTITMEHAPLQGNYVGSFQIVEYISPTFYRFHFEGEGERGAFSGSGQIQLQEQHESTIVAYKGTLTLSATTTQFHPTLVKGAIKLLIQQCFTALAADIHAYQVAEIATRPGEYPGSSQVRGSIVVLPSANKQARPAPINIFTYGARFLHLGEGDPQQEAVWAQRLRNVSYISGILLLVWLGTRLSRRDKHS